MAKLIDKIEAVLFSSGDWVSQDKIKDIVGSNNVLASLNLLKKKFGENFSFEVQKNDLGEWRMCLKDEFSDTSPKILSQEIPKKTLKVLSIIAYEQPISKTNLAKILGRYAKEDFDFLYKRGFIVYSKKGNGKYYKVTSKFYNYFNLNDSKSFRQFVDEKNINLKNFFLNK